MTSNNLPPRLYYRLDEAAQILGCTERDLIHWGATGKITINTKMKWNTSARCNYIHRNIARIILESRLKAANIAPDTYCPNDTQDSQPSVFSQHIDFIKKQVDGIEKSVPFLSFPPELPYGYCSLSHDEWQKLGRSWQPCNISGEWSVSHDTLEIIEVYGETDLVTLKSNYDYNHNIISRPKGLLARPPSNYKVCIAKVKMERPLTLHSLFIPDWQLSAIRNETVFTQSDEHHQSINSNATHAKKPKLKNPKSHNAQRRLALQLGQLFKQEIVDEERDQMDVIMGLLKASEYAHLINTPGRLYNEIDRAASRKGIALDVKVDAFNRWIKQKL